MIEQRTLIQWLEKNFLKPGFGTILIFLRSMYVHCTFLLCPSLVSCYTQFQLILNLFKLELLSIRSFCFLILIYERIQPLQAHITSYSINSLFRSFPSTTTFFTLIYIKNLIANRARLSLSKFMQNHFGFPIESSICNSLCTPIHKQVVIQLFMIRQLNSILVQE